MTIRDHIARLYRVTFRPHFNAFGLAQCRIAMAAAHLPIIGDYIAWRIWLMRDMTQDSANYGRAAVYEMRRLTMCPNDTSRSRAIRAGHGFILLP